MVKINELKSDMARYNISQKKIAKAICKTEATVSLIFNEKADFSNNDSTIIADLLHMSNERRGFVFLNSNLTKL